MGKRRKLPEIENIEIVDAGAKGKAIGKYQDKVVFVSYGIPGDIVNIQLTKQRRRYFEGRITKVIKYSDKRVEPKCEYFGTCGGCKWQSMAYDDQLFYKEKQVRDNLSRLSNIVLPEIKPILASPEHYFYRNKLEFTFSNKKWITDYSRELDFSTIDMNGLGFHLPGMFDRILDIEHCYLQNTLSDMIRLSVKKYALDNEMSFYDVKEKKGLLRNLTVRNTEDGQWMVIVVFFEETEKNEGMLNHIKDSFPEITSLNYIINPKQNDTTGDLKVHHFSGKTYIMESMEGISFKIGPKSFYQTNSPQALKMYQVVREYADLKGNEIVYDLYTGTGTIALFISKDVKKVVGIEYVDEAIADAKENAILNSIENAKFFAGDMVNVLNEKFVKRQGKPEVIITDPPRSGMHPKVIQQIIRIAPQKVVYVSCNPATQARDLDFFDEFYEVVKVQPLDMFPQTHHVENIVLLERREKPIVKISEIEKNELMEDDSSCAR